MQSKNRQLAAVRVLVVDDIEVNRRIRRALLETQGYEVEVAANGAEALEIARKNPPQLVVSDVMMPEMDGFTLCREWKSDPRLRGVPFVFYTATYTTNEDRRLAQQLGADAYLTKNMDSQDFLQTVIDIVDRAGGEVREIEAPLRDEESYYKACNQRVQEKLEQKIEQLERANREILARERELHESKALLEQRIVERTAAMQAANRELEAFSYSVSHDLRAPLRAIDGYTAMLMDEYRPLLDDRGRDMLARTRVACQRMSVLIDKLLELSGVTRRQPRRRLINLGEIAADVADQLGREAPQRQVEWRIQEDLYAECDPELLRIVLENLLGNAWKYTALREQAVIEFYSTQVAQTRLYCVRDNGVGFDPAMASRLFVAFSRLHDDAGFPGSGIGLATVQRIIDRHGGGVWADGEEGVGATFSFSLSPLG